MFLSRSGHFLHAPIPFPALPCVDRLKNRQVESELTEAGFTRAFGILLVIELLCLLRYCFAPRDDAIRQGKDTLVEEERERWQLLHAGCKDWKEMSPIIFTRIRIYTRRLNRWRENLEEGRSQ